MKKQDYEDLDIESRIEAAMKLMKTIMKFSDNDIEKNTSDYCFHKLENLKVITKVIAESED